MLIISWIYQFSSIHSSIHRAHVKKVGHTSEYLFAIYWWTWKAAINLKNCWNIPIKNERFLIFKMLLSCFFFFFFFLLKKRKTPGDTIILHLYTNNLDDMIYGSWDTECDRLKLVIMGHFWSFVWFLRYGTEQTEFLVILGYFFALLTP